MIDISEFEEYLVFDSTGEPVGVKQEAPAEVKMKFREWYNDYLDRIRLAELFSTQS